MLSLEAQKVLKAQNDSLMSKMLALQKETDATVRKIIRDANRAIVTAADRMKKEKDDEMMAYTQ
jgi:hypothetical protein